MRLLIPLVFLLSLAGCSESPDSNSVSDDHLAGEAAPTDSLIQVTDFSGRVVTLEQPARTIVALAPHIVENVYTAGAGDRLTGIVSYSDYPAEATSLPLVGGYASVNLEKIVELQPDLVIAWESGNADDSIERIRELGFTVYMDQPDTLEDIAKSLTDIGILSGTSDVADSATDRFLLGINTLREQYTGKTPVATFYQVWNDPLQTINGTHIISDAIALCGGQNIYADETPIAPVINIESILERNPTAIIASGMSDERPDWLDDWKAWPSLAAVQLDNLFFVDPDHIQRHTVRILLGIEAICAQLDSARTRANNSD